MNLYNYHSDPKSLKNHDTAHESVPKLAWHSVARADMSNKEHAEEMKRKEHVWAKDPYTAFSYASWTHKPFPLGEKALAKNAEYAFRYATRITKKRFPEAEKEIAESNFAYDYAMAIIKGRWPIAEKKWLKQFAENDSRAPDMLMMNDYIRLHFPEKRWPELERALIKAKATDRLYAYVSVILRKPFPEAEAIIATSPYDSLVYAQYVLRGPFPAGEKAIRSNSTLSARYDHVIKNMAAAKKALTNQYGDED